MIKCLWLDNWGLFLLNKLHLCSISCHSVSYTCNALSCLCPITSHFSNNFTQIRHQWLRCLVSQRRTARYFSLNPLQKTRQPKRVKARPVSDLGRYLGRHRCNCFPILPDLLLSYCSVGSLPCCNTGSDRISRDSIHSLRLRLSFAQLFYLLGLSRKRSDTYGTGCLILKPECPSNDPSTQLRIFDHHYHQPTNLELVARSCRYHSIPRMRSSLDLTVICRNLMKTRPPTAPPNPFF